MQSITIADETPGQSQEVMTSRTLEEAFVNLLNGPIRVVTEKRGTPTRKPRRQTRGGGSQKLPTIQRNRTPSYEEPAVDNSRQQAIEGQITALSAEIGYVEQLRQEVLEQYVSALGQITPDSPLDWLVNRTVVEQVKHLLDMPQHRDRSVKWAIEFISKGLNPTSKLMKALSAMTSSKKLASEKIAAIIGEAEQVRAELLSALDGDLIVVLEKYLEASDQRRLTYALKRSITENIRHFKEVREFTELSAARKVRHLMKELAELVEQELPMLQEQLKEQNEQVAMLETRRLGIVNEYGPLTQILHGRWGRVVNRPVSDSIKHISIEDIREALTKAKASLAQKSEPALKPPTRPSVKKKGSAAKKTKGNSSPKIKGNGPPIGSRNYQVGDVTRGRVDGVGGGGKSKKVLAKKKQAKKR